jgi:hypothetical protein
VTTLERRRNWKISVYGREHGVPHLHVTGPDFSATMAIANGELLTGGAPAAVLAQVRAWLIANRAAAAEQWQVLNPTL